MWLSSDCIANAGVVRPAPPNPRGRTRLSALPNKPLPLSLVGSMPISAHPLIDAQALQLPSSKRLELGKRMNVKYCALHFQKDGNILVLPSLLLLVFSIPEERTAEMNRE